MSMQLKQKEVLLSSSGDKKILVSEAGWDYTFRFSETEKELEPKLADPNHNEIFKFFCRNYYALMASCVVGDVPSPEEAFALERQYLDNWYLTVWELNPEIITLPLEGVLEAEKVDFRDGSYVYVFRARGIPSFMLKLIELERQALDHPLENDPSGQMFVSLFYPKMAAACNGSADVPDALTVRNWPRAEIGKWMDASKRLNPEWFAMDEEVQAEEAKANKKKVRKR